MVWDDQWEVDSLQKYEMQEIVGQANGTPLTVGKGSKMLTIQYLRIIKILQNRRISVYTNQKLKIICQFDYFFYIF